MDTHHTEHPLQPHQIALLSIFYFAFKDMRSKTYHAGFLLYLQRTLLEQISEVSLPITALDLQRKLEATPLGDSLDARTLVSTFKAFRLETADQLIDFFSGPC
jgi:anaphase-promoting complex subunit 5